MLYCTQSNWRLKRSVKQVDTCKTIPSTGTPIDKSTSTSVESSPSCYKYSVTKIRLLHFDAYDGVSAELAYFL